MRLKRFGSKSGTHRALLEQTTFGRKLDCAIEFKRTKLARKHIWIAENRDLQKSHSGHANQGKWGPQQRVSANYLRTEFRQHHCIRSVKTIKIHIRHFSIRGL